MDNIATKTLLKSRVSASENYFTYEIASPFSFQQVHENKSPAPELSNNKANKNYEKAKNKQKIFKKLFAPSK